MRNYRRMTLLSVLASMLPAGALSVELVVLAEAPVWGQWQTAAPRDAPMQERGQRLLSRLQRGDGVRMVAFGDSLTAGWGTDGRHVYYRMVADALQFAFPVGSLEVIAHGHPGETTDGALRRFDAEVATARPDLLLVQFGGNDKGWGRPVATFRRDLGELLRRARQETEALVIACLPPIVDPDPANEWNESARAVAAQQGVVVADLDRAIREGDADFRGPFPYGSHPEGFTHVIMAHEVLRALREALGLQATLTCRLRGGTRLSASDAVEVEIEAANASGRPVDCTLQVEWQDDRTDDAVRVAPHKTSVLRRRIALPTFTGQSVRLPMRLFSRGGGFGDIDVKWLTIASAIQADTDAEAPTWHTIVDESFTIGRHQWLGPKDLAVRFAVAALADRIRFTLDVTDNDITVAEPEEPSQGDSAELYLDLRDDANQGKPVYSPEVLALQITPPTVAGGRTWWRSMQPLPAGLEGLAVSCARTEGGYRAQVDLPLQAALAARGGQWQGLGFDVGVNDADFGGVRKTQVMWTGYPDNYLNPAYLGGLYSAALAPRAMRQTLR